jgi:hypothetical protein
VQVDEHVVAQVLGTLERLLLLARLAFVLLAAHGGERLGHEVDRARGRGADSAIAHRDVDALALEVDHLVGSGDAHVDAGMLAPETREPRHQPGEANDTVVVTVSTWPRRASRSFRVASRSWSSAAATERW